MDIKQLNYRKTLKKLGKRYNIPDFEFQPIFLEYSKWITYNLSGETNKKIAGLEEEIDKLTKNHAELIFAFSEKQKYIDKLKRRTFLQRLFKKFEDE